MTDQVETKQVTWEDMEVAEEQCQGCFDPQCGVEVAEEDLPKGVLLIQGIDEEAWNEVMERRYANEFRASWIGAFQANASIVVNTNILPEDVENLKKRMGDKVGRLELMYGRYPVPPCTAHRNELTGQCVGIHALDHD